MKLKKEYKDKTHKCMVRNMGAWGISNFENDDAGDWICGLEKSKGIDALLKPIKSIIDNSEYLEVPDCCEALAAVEVIYASLSDDYSKIPDKAQGWLNKKQGILGKKPQIEKKHVLLGKQAIEKIILDSKLKELWKETDEFEKWLEIQNKVISGLSKNIIE